VHPGLKLTGPEEEEEEEEEKEEEEEEKEEEEEDLQKFIQLELSLLAFRLHIFLFKFCSMCMSQTIIDA
jgi:CO dehydrogenase/acetyl-CoA synthase beta subunit